MTLKNNLWELSKSSREGSVYDLTFHDLDLLCDMMENVNSFDDLTDFKQLLEACRKIVDSNGRIDIYKSVADPKINKLYRSSVVEYPCFEGERDFESLKQGFVDLFDFLQRRK